MFKSRIEGNAYAAKYSRTHKAKMRVYRARCTAKLKLEVLTHYGKRGKMMCSWKGCTISDPDVLELDHIHNDGAAMRKDHSNGRWWGGHHLYAFLRERKFPEGYQTLCCNHNRKKEILRRRK